MQFYLQYQTYLYACISWLKNKVVFFSVIVVVAVVVVIVVIVVAEQCSWYKRL